MDISREIDDKFLNLYCKKRIATLPVWNNQGKLVKKVQTTVDGPGKGGRGSAVKTIEVLVDGVDTTIWPSWIVDGINPMLLSDVEREELGIESWWLWKIKVAFWHPRLFFYPFFKGPNKVKCPSCGSEERVQGDGFPTRARATCGISGTIYLLAYRYRCVNCPGAKGQTKSFSSADPLVVDQYPGFIKRQYVETFYISHRGGLDREAKFVVDSLAVKAFGFSRSIKLVNECNSRQFHLTKELYYLHRESLQQAEKGSIRKFFKKVAPSTASGSAQPLPASSQSAPSSSAPSSSSAAPSQTLAREDPFGKFQEPGCGYRCYIPGAGYWITGYLEDFKCREKWLQRQLEHTDAEFLRCDHTFQVAKGVRAVDGSQSCNNVFSVMNGFGEIIAQQAALTTSMDEVEPLLAALPLRNARFGFPPTKAGWVDNPDTVKYKLSKALDLDLERLLLDPLHAMMVVARTIPDDHSLKGAFMAGMSNAIFQMVEGDKALVIAYLRSKGLSTAEVDAKPARYFKQHCRRIIPAPQQLVESLQRLHASMANGFDTALGMPLFTKATEDAFERLISHADRGLLSDPFGVEEMYVQTGTWGNGIPKYAAVRGSSPLEGYHRHLALVLSGANNSADLAHSLLAEHKHEWNMTARISKWGQKDYGLLDTRPIESIKASCARLGLADPYPEYVTLTFEPRERFGFDALSPGKGPLLGVPLEEEDVREVPVVEDDGGASFFEDEACDEKRGAAPTARDGSRTPVAASSGRGPAPTPPGVRGASVQRPASTIPRGATNHDTSAGAALGGWGTTAGAPAGGNAAVPRAFPVLVAGSGGAAAQGESAGAVLSGWGDPPEVHMGRNAAVPGLLSAPGAAGQIGVAAQRDCAGAALGGWGVPPGTPGGGGAGAPGLFFAPSAGLSGAAAQGDRTGAAPGGWGVSPGTPGGGGAATPGLFSAPGAGHSGVAAQGDRTVAALGGWGVPSGVAAGGGAPAPVLFSAAGAGGGGVAVQGSYVNAAPRGWGAQLGDPAGGGATLPGLFSAPVAGVGGVAAQGDWVGAAPGGRGLPPGAPAGGPATVPGRFSAPGAALGSWKAPPGAPAGVGATVPGRFSAPVASQGGVVAQGDRAGAAPGGRGPAPSAPTGGGLHTNAVNFWSDGTQQQKRHRSESSSAPVSGLAADGAPTETWRSPMDHFEAMYAGEGSAANQQLGSRTLNERNSALPFGGRMRSKRGVRRKRMADLSTPVLSAKEVQWFVELQTKHKKGQSTNWAAMLNEWNTTLVQLSLDPTRMHLCQGVMPKSMGQLQKFERAAYDAINTCNSIASAFARPLQGVPTDPMSAANTTPTQIPRSIPHPPFYTIPLSTPAQFQTAPFHPAHFVQQQVPGRLQEPRPIPKGPNRGGLNTPHRCVPCSNATGQVVLKKGHTCPFKPKS